MNCSKDGAATRRIGCSRRGAGAMSGGKRDGVISFLRFDDGGCCCCSASARAWNRSGLLKKCANGLVDGGELVRSCRHDISDSMSDSLHGAPVIISALSSVWMTGDSHGESGLILLQSLSSSSFSCPLFEAWLPIFCWSRTVGLWLSTSSMSSYRCFLIA